MALLAIDLKKIGEYGIIKAISNNPDVDKSIIDKDYTIRIKQASDIKIIYKFNAVENILNESIRKAFILNLKDYYNKAKTQYHNILNNDKYEDILNQLPSFSETINVQLPNKLAEQLQHEQVKLQGIFNNIDEV